MRFYRFLNYRRRRYGILEYIFPALLIFFNIYLKKQINNTRKSHLFILRSFYYPESRLFDNSPRNSLVVLFNMEEHVPIDNFHAYCLAGKDNLRSRAQILPLFVGEVKCRLIVYRLICFPEEFSNIKLIIRQNEPVPLKLTPADQYKREIVVCPSRLFAFEQWHLFLTAMELHRLHRVELVIVYIQSVDAQVYKLIKLYERDGLLQIRPSLLMPSKLDTLEYNPNDETQWNNQIVNFQECLYEFRESAQFIVFPDWDDLIVTRNFQPLPSVLRTLRKDMPDICAFVYGRYIGLFDTLEEMFEQGDIFSLWENGISFTKNPNYIQHIGKALVRPRMVDSIRVHDAVVRSNCNQKEVPMHLSYIIHARNYYNLSLETTLDISQLVDYYEHFQDKFPIIKKIMDELPRKDSTLEQFYKCLGFAGTHDMWGRIFKIVQESTGSKCYSYARCQINHVRLANRCVNVQNSWKTTLARDFSISLLEKSTFMGKNFCIV